MSNIVYIAASIDGYIADKNGGLDWLQTVPNPDNLDFGYKEFMAGIDAVVMGRNTFETVAAMGIGWPYNKPVFVLSSSEKEVPDDLLGEVEFVRGRPEEIVKMLNQNGYCNLYIDGGRTVQGFLESGLIDQMIITRIPVLLGGGVSLFGNLPEAQEFDHVSTDIALGQLVISKYKKKKAPAEK